MRSRVFCFTLLSTIAISVAVSLPAQAQRARVFVSVTGDDANPCTAGSPCKTFQHAYDVVLAGGEISVLDTGGYGQISIAKAISIVSPAGVEASIAIPSGQVGILISAPTNAKVSLRGLTLDGTGAGAVGIELNGLNGGVSLSIEDCVVRNMTQDGLFFVSIVPTALNLSVSNSTFSDNGADGIHIATQGSGPVTGSVDNTRLYGNGSAGLEVSGLNGFGALAVAVTDSVASNNGTGFFVESNTGKSPSNLSLTRAQAAGNGFGVVANQTNATLWLAQTTVTANGTGFVATAGGVVKSYSDNYLAADNGAPNGSLSSVAKQ